MIQYMRKHQELVFMTITIGDRQMTIKELLTSIPLPRSWITDKDRRSAVVSELRPYFIMPRSEPGAFLVRLNEMLGIRELSPEDLSSAGLMHELGVIRHGPSDSFWLLEKNERSSMFFEIEFHVGDLTSEEYDDGRILIGCDPELDVFYSNSVFLDNVLSYLRGIGPEELLSGSKELYPILTAFAYADNLDGVLRRFSAYRGMDAILRALHADMLSVSELGGRTFLLQKQSFYPFFKKLFSSEICFSSRYPQKEEDIKYRLEFSGPGDTETTFVYGDGRLYFGPQEYYELRDSALPLTSLLDRIMRRTPCDPADRRFDPERQVT